MQEDVIFQNLHSAKQAQINVVGSAFDSIIADLSYLTMPVTAGKRLYELLDKYGVRSKEELEQKHPGVLWNEVVLPNIESGRNLAQEIHKRNGKPLIVPGIFDARHFEWSRDEYMVLWLRLITARAKEIYLAPGWQYASGGVAEFVRAMMIMFRFAYRENGIVVRNDIEQLVTFTEGSMRVAYALQDVRKRGYTDTRLEREFQNLVNIAYTLKRMTQIDKGVWEYHVQDSPESESVWVLSAAHSMRIKPHNLV